MKKYKFKLDALLKIRKIKEDQCKMHIGQLQVHLTALRSELSGHHKDISEAFELQEKSLVGGASGLETRFHPYFVQGKRTHIQKIEDEIEEFEAKVQQMYSRLNEFRADVKVITQMKEKDQKKYKKESEKKMNAEIEEQVQNWTQFNKANL
jgi:flagellar FliJ protein